MPPARPRQRSTTAEFTRGLRAYSRVPGVLTRLRLWPYQAVPAAISLVLSCAMLVGVYLCAGGLAGWVDGLINLPVGWLDTMVTWAAGALAFVVMLVAFFFLQKHVAMILLAPFLGLLAEKVVRRTTGREEGGGLPGLASLRRSLIINTRAVAFELGATVGLLVAGFLVPPISPFTTLFVFLIQARFAGFGLIDFPLEFHGFTVAESVRYAKHRRPFATGLGAGYLLLMLVPFLGWMFAPTFGTVAGTLETLEDLVEGEGK